MIQKLLEVVEQKKRAASEWQTSLGSFTLPKKLLVYSQTLVYWLNHNKLLL